MIPRPASAAASAVAAFLDFDGEHAGLAGERGERRRAQQVAGLDRHEVVADPLDLAEQVRGDDDRDPELGAGPPHEREHLVASARVEAVGRLVEEEQPRIVDERLGELHPLLHAGRVPADRPVALLEQPDVAQDLGGPLASGRRREAGHLGEVGDELGRRVVGRQGVVLGHVADELADAGALAGGVEVHDPRRSRSSAEGARAGS